MSAAYDVAVVGLGAMGSAALAHLARDGRRVVGFDRFDPPHPLGSTHGESRIIREAYFEDPRYVPWVQDAWRRWRELERDSGRALLLETGGMMIGPAEGPLVRGALASARAHDLPHEVLDAAAIRARVPAFAPDDAWVGVWEPRAGVLDPEAGVRAHLEAAVRAGAEVRPHVRVRRWRSGPHDVAIETPNGVVHAGQVVLAAGAWTSELLQGWALPLAVERVVQAWFAPAGDPAPLAPERCPISIWEYGPEQWFYAFPARGGRVKAALHHQGATLPPGERPSEVAPPEIDRIRAPLARHVPNAAGRCVEARTCLYTNTPDGHFVIDRHPADARVLVVSACSGHGFKFATVLGAEIAALLAGRPGAHDLAWLAAERLATR